MSVERLCISMESFTHEHLVSLVMNILLLRGSAGIDDILGILVRCVASITVPCTIIVHRCSLCCCMIDAQSAGSLPFKAVLKDARKSISKRRSAKAQKTACPSTVAHIAAAPLFFAHAIGDPKVAGQAQPSLSALPEVLQRMLAVPEIEHFADYASWAAIKRDSFATEVRIVANARTVARLATRYCCFADGVVRGILQLLHTFVGSDCIFGSFHGGSVSLSLKPPNMNPGM